MKHRFTASFRLAFALAALVFFAACNRDDYYNVPPPPQSSIVFNDDFNNDYNGWSFDDNYNDAHVSIYSGQLKYTFYPAAEGVHTATIPSGGNLDYDFLLQTSIRTNNATALLFGEGGYHYGYTLFVDAEGYFALYDEGDDDYAPEPVIDWTFSNAIAKGGWNDLVLENSGGRWVARANGVQLFNIAAQPVYGDNIGFMVLDNTTAFADYLTLEQ